jgi:hypothetical protein
MNKAEEPFLRGECWSGQEGYPLILTRQLTSQATKGERRKLGDLLLAFLFEGGRNHSHYFLWSLNMGVEDDHS